MKLLRRLSQKVIKYHLYVEKKTNKAKLDIFKFLRKSAESPLIKLAEIWPYIEIQ